MRMQKGRKSPGFEGGCFSPVLEQSVYRFHEMIGKAGQGSDGTCGHGSRVARFSIASFLSPDRLFVTSLPLV